MLSSTRSAKRRSSSRASPGAPRQTWYCSVSLAKKRRRAGWASGAAGSAGARPPTRSIAGALDELDERVVVDRAGRRHHDVGGHVARAVEAAQGVGPGAADDVGAADDRPPERMAAEDGLAEHVEDLVLRVVLVHGDLLEHDLALLLEL